MIQQLKSDKTSMNGKIQEEQTLKVCEYFLFQKIIYLFAT